MNRESIVTGLFGLGLGLTLCSVIVALIFANITKGDVLSITSGTTLININWVWLSNVFLTCALGMFVVSATVPLIKKVKPKTLIALIPLSVLYLVISAFDILTTDVLVKHGLGNEVNPVMSFIMSIFGVSYGLSLNFAVSIFIVIGLMYTTRKFLAYSATLTPISFVRGLIVFNNMTLLKHTNLEYWLLQMNLMIKQNLFLIILFSIAVVLGLTLTYSFPETEGEYRLPTFKDFLRVNPLKIRRKTTKKPTKVTRELTLTDASDVDKIDEMFFDPFEFTLLLERYRMKQEVINTLIEISKNISERKGIPVDKVTLKDIMDELRKR